MDLVLPINDDEPIEPGKSENFINELHRIGRLKKPIYIIGLSQYEDKVVANTSKYENKLWKLIHYNLKKVIGKKYFKMQLKQFYRQKNNY